MLTAPAIESSRLSLLQKNPNVRQAQDLGLQPRHAYTISKVLELRGSVGRAKEHAIPLVRVRNPHGDHKEWRGAWSDG